MTNIAEIFDKLDHDDVELMMTAWGFSPLTHKLDVQLLPFTSAYRMHSLLYAYQELGKGSRPVLRQIERLKRKLKRAVTRPFPRGKHCECPFCKNKRLFTPDPISGRVPRNRIPITQQLPRKGISGLSSSFVIMDDIVTTATENTENFSKMLRKLIYELDDNNVLRPLK